ncbi:MAG: hypothetical protein JO021_01305, partial [Alphaproteobacteria bacterium]|nr:hypothetical protein [Alphaproteobacteria bacterium]
HLVPTRDGGLALTVGLVEALGADTLVYGKAGAGRAAGRAAARLQHRARRRCRLERETGRRLG